MNIKKLKLNLLQIKTMDEFYDEISNLFGFPDFFGRNIDALIDCLFSLRYPEDEMTNVHLMDSEFMLLEVYGISSVDQKIRDTLIFAVEFANAKNNEKGNDPVIILSFMSKSSG
ncbi:barstar family protein [Marinibactrum halimedae]|uniref:Barstar (barnase inhibitor) domain-containing protein n=1 Tax=Marinibactrum halimedae TaxID=1444977 RepID=A0AA37T1Q0_9GAMM|nr:barstar family protein [Marinibactrum halimedae]MCD9461173.1 barstar family protein [Marinibactrum halimedae]GLS24608.1 hypothetical protein GCM10007877_03220 [Marinibactrum halimedae]